MKKELKEFFKNKFNLIMTIFQGLAFIFLGIAYFFGIGILFMLVCEGGVFITLGIKTIHHNKLIDKSAKMYEDIGLGIDDSDDLEKKRKRIKRSNVLQGILYIIMGIILSFIALF